MRRLTAEEIKKLRVHTDKMVLQFEREEEAILSKQGSAKIQTQKAQPKRAKATPSTASKSVA